MNTARIYMFGLKSLDKRHTSLPFYSELSREDAVSRGGKGNWHMLQAQALHSVHSHSCDLTLILVRSVHSRSCDLTLILSLLLSPVYTAGGKERRVSWEVLEAKGVCFSYSSFQKWKYGKILRVFDCV